MIIAQIIIPGPNPKLNYNQISNHAFEVTIIIYKKKR